MTKSKTKDKENVDQEEKTILSEEAKKVIDRLVSEGCEEGYDFQVFTFRRKGQKVVILEHPEGQKFDEFTQMLRDVMKEDKQNTEKKEDKASTSKEREKARVLVEKCLAYPSKDEFKTLCDLKPGLEMVLMQFAAKFMSPNLQFAKL